MNFLAYLVVIGAFEPHKNPINQTRTLTTKMKNISLLVAVATIALAVPTFTHAQEKSMAKKPAMKSSKMTHKMSGKMSSTVYVCKECKMAYSMNTAKSMKMKDGMGHMLTKMSKMPAGYKMMDGKIDKMGSKMDKMDKMDKMGGKK
jgi:transposase-like protein